MLLQLLRHEPCRCYLQKPIPLPPLQTGGSLVAPLQAGSLSAATSPSFPASTPTSSLGSGTGSSLDWVRPFFFLRCDKVSTFSIYWTYWLSSSDLRTVVVKSGGHVYSIITGIT